MRALFETISEAADGTFASQRALTAIKRQVIPGAVFVAVFSLSTFFLGLGTPALWDRDETTYAIAAREMQARNDWLMPTIEGRPFLEKPILMYWLVRASYAGLGFDEFSSRLPSAVFGFFTCFTIFFMARALWGGEAAVYAAIVFSTSLLPAVVFRLLVPDPALTFFTALAFASYLRSTAKAEGDRRFLALAYASIALGFLAKGPIALFPAPVFVLHGWLIRRASARYFGRLTLRHAFLIGLAVALAAPWFAYAFYTHEDTAARFFLHENLQRFASVIEGHRGNAMYYVPVLLMGMFPWPFFLIASSNNLTKKGTGLSAADPDILLFVLWIVIPLTALSLSATKLPHYLLIVFPAIACLTGKFLSDAASGARSLQAPLAATASFCVLLAAALVVTHFAAPRYAPAAVLYPFLLLSLFSFAATLSAFRRRPRRAIFLMCAGAAVFCVGLFVISLHVVENMRVMRPIALAAKRAADRGGVLYRYGVSEPSLILYSGRILPAVKKGGLDDVLSRTDPVYIVVSEAKLKHAAPQTPYTIVAEKTGFAENSGPMTLLLIANRPP
jgi:4-amino-4-deoxy-L-arabinose transferase-like glycosyltransferase